MRFEMMYLILAGIILGSLIIGENGANETTAETLTTSQLGLNAVAIANSFIERATSTTLAFDEYTIGNPVRPNQSDSTGGLDKLSTPGRDAGEMSQALYDDVDDFNGMDTMITVSSIGNFHVHTSVTYYDPAAGSPTLTKTWFKQFVVSVADTVPGSTTHNFQFNGQQARIQKNVILSYYKFLQ